MHEIKAELMHLALNKKRHVRYILLTIIVTDDNDITPRQRQCIKNLYLALGLNESMLENDINRFMASHAPQPQPINDNIHFPSHQSELNLQTLTSHTNENDNGNKKTISATFSDDKIAQAEQATTSSSLEKVTARYGQKSLSEKREQLYKKLIQKEKWSHIEFNRLCKHYKLAPNGAIEIINNWAYQQAGESVLHKNDHTIFMNRGIVEKIQQNTATATY
jgi:hypothetical protein